MNVRTLIAAGALAFVTVSSLPVVAQTDELIAGQVTKVDESAGKITIKHGPIKKFDMDDGMTMVFRAGETTMTKTVKAGDKVRFVPDRVNGQFMITKIEKVK